MIQEHIKEAMKDMEKFKESKIWGSLYFKCFICQEIKPIVLGNIVEGLETSRFDYNASPDFKMTIEQVFEVCCKDCVELLPKAPIFEED